MDASSYVVSVHRSARHVFSKSPHDQITLLRGLGVEGDAHCGGTVQNIYQMKKDRNRPNLRQVHLLGIELLEELHAQGLDVQPGDLGENISTHGLSLRGMARGTRLHLGDHAIVEVTGLRTPCVQIERFRNGLKARVAERRPGGDTVLKAGLMGIVLTEGVVKKNDRIVPEAPPEPHAPLGPV
jgi:MOSC domain-containing protein YiiM